ncbi:MAG: 2-C-methyl-D-erythritol 4-phosphate cytidylyltransferase, partial [Bacillales bacterium]|nr:2-C-methyl-D-erythritol 4-phosphate cytidylyltransferase [Bacillales bacterium]
QTPQGFAYDTIIEAYQYSDYQYKDEGSLVQEVLKIKPFLVVGDIENIKVTYESDLKLIKEMEYEN